MSIIPFLPISVGMILLLLVIPAILAAKLRKIAPTGMTHGQCWGRIVNGGVMMELSRRDPEETEEFRREAMNCRLILFGMYVLIGALTWGLFLILQHALKQ
jgi:hypothetical protein